MALAPRARSTTPTTPTVQRADHSPANRRTTNTAATRQTPLISNEPKNSDRGLVPETL